MESPISPTEAKTVPLIIPVPVMFSGVGYDPVFICDRVSPFSILERVVTLSESRALEEYPEREVKAMAQSMTRMVITTMSSTRVKP